MGPQRRGSLVYPFLLDKPNNSVDKRNAFIVEPGFL